MITGTLTLHLSAIFADILRKFFHKFLYGFHQEHLPKFVDFLPQFFMNFVLQLRRCFKVFYSDFLRPASSNSSWANCRNWIIFFCRRISPDNFEEFIWGIFKGIFFTRNFWKNFVKQSSRDFVWDFKWFFWQNFQRNHWRNTITSPTEISEKNLRRIL